MYHDLIIISKNVRKRSQYPYPVKCKHNFFKDIIFISNFMDITDQAFLNRLCIIHKKNLTVSSNCLQFRISIWSRYTYILKQYTFITNIF